MKVKKPNPKALSKTAKLIIDLVKKKPSDDFFESVEKTRCIDCGKETESGSGSARCPDCWDDKCGNHGEEE
jgi:hypothetical protein